MNKHLLILLFILGFSVATGHAQGDPPPVAPVETVFNDTVVFKKNPLRPVFRKNIMATNLSIKKRLPVNRSGKDL